MTSNRVAQIVIFGATVAWFGGLLRLFGEAAARLLLAVAPTESEQRTATVAIALAIVVIGVEALLLWRWSWYRGMIRQNQDDIRSIYGLPLRTAATQSLNLKRVVSSTAIVLVPALVLAAVLPGAIAAAIAILVGLVLRVAAVVLAVT